MSELAKDFSEICDISYVQNSLLRLCFGSDMHFLGSPDRSWTSLTCSWTCSANSDTSNKLVHFYSFTGNNWVVSERVVGSS